MVNGGSRYRSQLYYRVGQLGNGVRFCQVDGQQATVIVVAGDNYKVLGGLAPAFRLGLMAEYKDVNVKKPGHFVKCLLAYVSSPG